MALFINNGGPVKIRIGKANNCYWATIKTGEIVELSMEKGLAYGFSIKTTEGQIGNKVVETKQIDTVNDTVKTPGIPVKDFLKELCSIKGIGKKTAEDIVNWGTREKLIDVIATRGSLPFRDDIEKLLEESYGTK